MRICSRCGINKKLEAFTKNKKCSEGYERKCKECTQKSRKTPEQISNQKRLAANHYEENKQDYLNRVYMQYWSDPETFRAYGRKHAKDNPEIYKAARHRRRAKIKENSGNNLTANEIRLLLDNFKFCIYCNSIHNLSIDHIIPISKGGENTLSNLVVACRNCNSSKRARGEEFLFDNTCN